MSFYDNDGSWSAPGRQPSWEQPPPPSRSGPGSSMSPPPESTAFASQFEEIERATDNLMKSGKWMPAPMQAMSNVQGRQGGMGQMSRGYEYGGDPRMGGGQPRQPSGGDYDNGRPGSAGMTGYYSSQRYPGGRPNEAEQMLQAKRRMAAQRERELRNYHQEQQYHRTVSGVKSDRSMSPNTMSEEDRRELIARQHRALYGDSSSLYGADAPNSRPQSQDVRVSSSGRGPSPLAFDPYGVQGGSVGESAVQMPPRDHGNSTTSPSSNPTTQQSFNLMTSAQQSSRTSNSSPGESPPPGQSAKGGAAGVAPIGTRPMQPPTSAGGVNQRSTTPLTPSSLGYGYSADGQSAAGSKDERSTSASSNTALADNKGVSGLGSWGGNSGVWGSGKGTLAVQPSVWG